MRTSSKKQRHLGPRPVGHFGGMKSRALAVLFVIGCMASLATVPLRASTPQELIQPGAKMVAPAECTLNFVFRNAGSGGARYIGTAGHCVGRVGQRVRMAGGEIGTVAFFAYQGSDDFALIRIDEKLWPHVSAEVRGHQAPTGFTTAESTSAGDPVSVYGHAMVLGSSEVTRPRSGLLTANDETEWYAALPTVFGDSGGPVLHTASGAALGVVSGMMIGETRPHTSMGTTVERVLELLSENGIDVELVTV